MQTEVTFVYLHVYEYIPGYVLDFPPQTSWKFDIQSCCEDTTPVFHLCVHCRPVLRRVNLYLETFLSVFTKLVNVPSRRPFETVLAGGCFSVRHAVTLLKSW